MAVRNGADAASDYDVMAAEPMGGDDDEGHDWDANEMGRAAGEDESEPLDDADDDVGSDIDETIGDEDADDDELEADGEDEDGEEGEEDEGEEYEPLEPQANWPAEFKEAFTNLPPQFQHFVMNTARSMQADYTRKTQAIAQERQQMQGLRQAYSEFDRIIGPRQQAWALSGMNPAQAITQLIALSDFATQDAPGFIKYFANLRGVDLQTLNQQQEYVDPQVAALRQPIAQVQAQLNQLSQSHAQQQQQYEQQQYYTAFHNTNANIENFARQTGEDGRPLYPFFNDVEEDMTALIESGRARSLPEAYSQAVWLNPQTRSRMLARSRADENAKARERAGRAKRAASSLTGASGANGAFNRGDMSIRDTIDAAWTGEI